MFSFDYAIEKIPEKKTRDLFREVYSSYCNGNYRSAVVMLWTVVVCDVLFKLQYLRDVYQDQKAIEILEKIQRIQDDNKKSSEWETKLIDLVFERTHFLNDGEKQSIDFLHSNRHLAAHPIIENGELYQPNAERTRDLLRIALDSILTKDAFLTKSIIVPFLEDLSMKKDRLKNFENVDTYLKSRYFQNINAHLIRELFKTLWRFVISPHTDIETENQWINAMALQSLLCYFSPTCREILKNENVMYGAAICQSNNDTGLDFAIDLCKKFEWFYEFLPTEAKIILTNRVLNKRSAEDCPLARFLGCTFLSKTIENHLSVVIDKLGKGYLDMSQMNHDDISVLLTKSKQAGVEQLFYKMCIKIYSRSSSFNAADYRFTTFIRPYLSEFNKDTIIDLIRNTNQNHINGNNQTCARNAALKDHLDVLQAFMQIGGVKEEICEYSDWLPLLSRIEPNQPLAI